MKKTEKQIVILLITAMLLLFALCACNKTFYYAVTFDAQNGTELVTLQFDENFKMPQDPVREGYEFEGWYTDPDGTAGNEWQAPTVLNFNITVYAKWKKLGTDPQPTEPEPTEPDTPDPEPTPTPNPTPEEPEIFSITFNLQNGADNIVVKFDENFKIPDNPTWEGYTFDGWYTDENCSDGSEWQTPSVLNFDITVYAKWTKNAEPTPQPDPVNPTPNPEPEQPDAPEPQIFSVTFDPQNGEEKIVVKFDENFQVPDDPTLENYVFGGWFTDENCSDGNEWQAPSVLNFDITVYAKWTKNADPTPQPSTTNTLQQLMQSQNCAIGLPSTGTYDCLVVPIKFANTKITSTDFENLNIAFNGTSEQTGWESVNTYYAKSSYGKLNLNFDIWGYDIGTKNQPYVSSKRSSSYELMKDRDGYANGDQQLLKEVLTYLSTQDIDLSHYDSDNDGTIDAVYLIFSVDVDYDSYDPFWWAYVSQTEDQTTFDGVKSCYYLFAGLDFMTEDVPGSGNIYNGEIDGLKINAATFIHETGHLLGLDDYYDYYVGDGCDYGLGGADMMDQTVGDHNVYSKIMMGWLEPTKITQSGTYTIDLSDSDLNNNCLMISLDGSGSYFGEYLLIDLYSATGLNALHASLDNSLLYGGAKYGARIYHVDSSCNNPYSTSYYSFTDNNNSDTDTPLIKLVEADGRTTKNTNRNGGCWANENDLWQTGDDFGKVFGSYKTYDNKVINFDIVFVEVTSTKVTVTITFA